MCFVQARVPGQLKGRSMWTCCHRNQLYLALSVKQAWVDASRDAFPSGCEPAAGAKYFTKNRQWGGRSMLSAFGGEDEDDKPKRVLRPIQYTEEELRAMQVRPWPPVTES